MERSAAKCREFDLREELKKTITAKAANFLKCVNLTCYDIEMC